MVSVKEKLIFRPTIVPVICSVPEGVCPEMVVPIWLNVQVPVRVDRFQLPEMFTNAVGVPAPRQPPRNRGKVMAKRIREMFIS